MDSIVIEGNGPLSGTVTASGAKNAALPILASVLLAEGTHALSNVPKLADVTTMLKLLNMIGCEGALDFSKKAHAINLTVPASVVCEATYDLVRTMRASVLVLGPLVARYGRARVSLPGGCAIGARPIDQHLKGLTALGCEIELAQGYVEARCKRLKGADFTFDVITVTGTENVMMAATLAQGRTVLQNAAREPEVEDLAKALNSMGARISGAGTSTITIDGVDALKPASHEIIADRIESGTLLIAAAITQGNVLVKGAVPHHLEALLQKLRAVGCEVIVESDGIRCRASHRISAVDLKTVEHPGFPTDMQAQMMALLATAEGTSVITETIFENRFMHVAELQRMGADITVDGHSAVVRGVKRLLGAQVMATDLRASASLVLAGLHAEGSTTVGRVYHLDRGYEQLENKLEHLGARVKRLKAPSP